MNKVNVPVAIWSLLISVLLWMNVYSAKFNKPVQRTVSLPLSTYRLDEKKYAVTDMPNDFSITLAGTKDQIRNLNLPTLSGFVDLSNAEPGEKNYQVFVYPNTTRELLVNSAITVRIKVEPLTTKRLDVTAYANPTAKSASQNVDVWPRSVFVTGAASSIEKIDSVRVFLSDDSKSFTQEGGELSAKAFDAKQVVIPKLILSMTTDFPPFNSDNATGELRVRARVKTDAVARTPAAGATK